MVFLIFLSKLQFYMLLFDVVELIHYRGSAFETQRVVKHPADNLHLLAARLLFGAVVFLIAVVTEQSKRYTERLEIDLPLAPPAK